MRLSTCFAALALALVAACTVSAQQSGSDFAVTIGALSGNNPNTASGLLVLGSSPAFEANYARRFNDKQKWAALYWEINALVSPFRHLSGVPVSATGDVRSVYVTPGVRLQFAQQERITPWIDGGAGYAFYDSSGTNIAGGATGSSGTANTYAAEFGAGVDIVASEKYVIRGAVQGFYTGDPNYGVVASGGQFNFVISGGIVWRFGK
jgi:outer membrane protein W